MVKKKLPPKPAASVCDRVFTPGIATTVQIINDEPCCTRCKHPVKKHKRGTNVQ